MLFHVSEVPGIARFEPRRYELAPRPVVWAIDEPRLRNYLLPRDCPRVTYYAGPETTEDDVRRFLGSSSAVVAIESGWLERARSCRLFVYRMPPETFACVDDCAGYHVSHVAVVPERVEVLDDPIAELVRRGVELRVLPSLFALRDDVVKSTLRFSNIRMRNAAPSPSPAPIEGH